MIPNVLPFQPEAAPAVLPSVGRGAATPASDSGGFAGILQVKLPGPGDSPASAATGTDGGSAQPALSAIPLAPTDTGANTTAAIIPDPSTTTAGTAPFPAAADTTSSTQTTAPQTIPQFAVGKGNVFGFPNQQVAGLSPQEVTTEIATPEAAMISDAKPAVLGAPTAAPHKSGTDDDAAPVEAAHQQADRETPSTAAATAVPAPQIAALAAAVAVPTTSTMTAPQPTDLQPTTQTGREPVVAVSPSASPLPASSPDAPAPVAAFPQDQAAATATTDLSARQMAATVTAATSQPVAGVAPPVSAPVQAAAFAPAAGATGQPSLQEKEPLVSFREAPAQSNGTVTTAATSDSAKGTVEAEQTPEQSSISAMPRDPRAAQDGVQGNSAAVTVAAGGIPPKQDGPTVADGQQQDSPKVSTGGAATPQGGSAGGIVAPETVQVAVVAPGAHQAAVVTPETQQAAVTVPENSGTGVAAPAPQQAAASVAAPQSGPISNPVREQGGAFREERSARMVREFYGSGYRAKTDPQEDAAQLQASAELRDSGAQPQTSDTKTASVSEKSATVSAEGTSPAPTQSQTVQPQPMAAGPAVSGTEAQAVREQTDAQAAQPVPTGTAADATGGATSAKGLIHEGGTAAAGTVQQGELKQETRGTEQPQAKVAEAGTANATVKAETGRDGGFADPERKEQQDQKAQVKEGTQVQPPLGMGAPQQAPAEATASETKSAATTTALHQSILSQIKDGAVVHDGNGNGQISIRLNPNELGELKIQVRMDSSNNVRVEVQADNKMVKDLLLSNVQTLKETLAAKNFTMDGFDVSTGSRDGFNNPLQDDRANWQQQQQRPATRSASLVSYSDGAEPTRVNYLTGDVNNLLSVRL